MNHDEAASPPLYPRARAARGYGAAPPASRVAIALAARRACRPALDPGASAAPDAQKRCGAAGALPATPRGAQHQQSRSNPYKQVSTVSGDCQPVVLDVAVGDRRLIARTRG